jgi:hypothetical protein
MDKMENVKAKECLQDTLEMLSKWWRVAAIYHL